MMSQITLPLFPLSTVLYPDALLPLQIFEVRYLEMIRKCLKDNSGFGIISLKAGSEVRRPDEQIELARHGTLVKINKADAADSTLIKITVQGTHRFELLSCEQQSNGLWIGQVTLMPPDNAIEIPEDLKNCANALAELIDSFDEKGITPEQIPFSKPYRLMDCGWVANRWSELLPLDPTTKLQFLTIDSPLLRLELVADQLQDYGLIKP